MEPRRLRCFGLGIGEGQGRAEAGPCALRPLALALSNGVSRVLIWNSHWRKRICLAQLSIAFLVLFLRSVAPELPGRTVVPSQQLLSCGFPFPLLGASGHACGKPGGRRVLNRGPLRTALSGKAMCVRRPCFTPAPERHGKRESLPPTEVPFLCSSEAQMCPANTLSVH